MVIAGGAEPALRVAVLGAGSIGCFVGGCWQAAGIDIRLIGRARIGEEIARHGLRLSDYRGWECRLEPGSIEFATDAAAMAEAEVIVLSVKSGSTAEAADQIAAYARDGATVISLQNGISNVDRLERALADRFSVVRGMVPYNVACLGPGHFHKGVAGDLHVADAPVTRRLAEQVRGSPAAMKLCEDMPGIAWGKLLINLNNAVNALSGRSLVEELHERDYRRVLAASQREGLRLLGAARIAPAKVGAVGPRLLPWVIASPDWLFRSVFLKRWKIDAKARSSMADDLAAGRRTEVDYLNGELVGLAEQLGLAAPINSRIVELVREAEAGRHGPWEPRDLRRAVLSR